MISMVINYKSKKTIVVLVCASLPLLLIIGGSIYILTNGQKSSDYVAQSETIPTPTQIQATVNVSPTEIYSFYSATLTSSFSIDVTGKPVKAEAIDLSNALYQDNGTQFDQDTLQTVYQIGTITEAKLAVKRISSDSTESLIKNVDLKGYKVYSVSFDYTSDGQLIGTNPQIWIARGSDDQLNYVLGSSGGSNGFNVDNKNIVFFDSQSTFDMGRQLMPTDLAKLTFPVKSAKSVDYNYAQYLPIPVSEMKNIMNVDTIAGLSIYYGAEPNGQRIYYIKSRDGMIFELHLWASIYSSYDPMKDENWIPTITF
jgi:hypothetical protein